MTDDNDDELQSLLDQLDDDEDVVDQIEDEVSRITEGEVEVVDSESMVAESDDSENVDLEPAECALQPVDTRQIEEISTTIVAEVPTVPTVDVVKYHERLDQVTIEVLAACRADRQETQDVIDLMRLQIDDAVNKSQSPSRMWVDGLVKAVEVKAGINATAVKIIEANAKMLAATKAGVNILNQNVNTGSQDLEDVLSRPLTDIDEF